MQAQNGIQNKFILVKNVSVFYISVGSDLPICIGSGITPTNVHSFRNVDAFIVGTFFKKDGMWQNELDENRIIKMMAAIDDLKGKNWTAH